MTYHSYILKIKELNSLFLKRLKFYLMFDMIKLAKREVKLRELGGLWIQIH